MIDRKNRDGFSAARIHDAEGLARRPSSPTIDIHVHIVVPQAAALAQPHLDPNKVPIARFANTASKEINAQQTNDVREVMTTIDRRLPRSYGHRRSGRGAGPGPLLLLD
jgi:aminocarboxymuconate-semialdehyde decarboxylase